MLTPVGLGADVNSLLLHGVYVGGADAVQIGIICIVTLRE
jgi:hypothetical protein